MQCLFVLYKPVHEKPLHGHNDRDVIVIYMGRN
jgi:hypothetical protein